MTQHCRSLIFRALLAGLLSAAMLGATPAYSPTESYQQQKIEGWTVHVSAELRADPDQCQKVLDLLRVKLFDIGRVVPPAALKCLRRVPFWVEREDRGFPCMCYHPSRQWLEENGYNPQKAKGVEIANAKTFLDWSLDQPWMVLHELAHAYHDQVLGFDDPQVKAAYDRIVKSHKYDAVLHINGRTVRAYALTDEKEFFAESSEAYFGTNDFFPFVRAELRQFDPETFDLLKKDWNLGQPKAASEAPAKAQDGRRPDD